MTYSKQAVLVVAVVALSFTTFWLGKSSNGHHPEQTGEQALERFIDLDTRKDAIEKEMASVAEKAKTEIGTKIDYFEGLRNRLESATAE